MERDNGGSAFPYLVPERFTAAGEGMSLRDYFAGQALLGVQIAQIHGALTGSGTMFLEEKDTAEAAYTIADAMLEARKK